MPTGGCHCGAVRYEMPIETVHSALCHCSDCRRHAGAPMVGWAMVPAADFKLEGEPVTYSSSEHGRRHFCGICGTGIFYTNHVIFPDMVDVQIATLDDPDLIAPAVQIQLAERIGWMKRLDELPLFERYPG